MNKNYSRPEQNNRNQQLNPNNKKYWQARSQATPPKSDYKMPNGEFR